MKRTIAQEHSGNFQTLIKAIKSDRLVLMDCINRKTKEHLAVICAVNREENNDLSFVPMAAFFNSNPYDLLINPNDPEYSQLNQEESK
jgi:hypothetical protein